MIVIICILATSEWTLAKRSPEAHIPKEAPFVIAPKLIVNCKTVPNFSTINTKPKIIKLRSNIVCIVKY